MRLLSEHKYFLVERQYVHSFRNEAPTFVLTTAGKNSNRLQEKEPLIIYERPGEYTVQMAALLTKPAG
jgi:tRNA1(Val) A37 N6-methylase TrmN6